MKIEIGQPAPDFTLYDSEKKQVTLSESERIKMFCCCFSHWLLPATCTKELCTVRDNIAWYNNAQCKVFGISVDSLHTLAKYKEDQQLNFTLLSDFNKEVSSLMILFMKCLVIT